MDGENADEGHRIRRGRRRFLLGVFGTLFLFAVVSFLVGLLQARGDPSFLFEDGEPPVWVEVVGMVLAVLGLLVEVAGIVWGIRSGRFRAGRESRLWAVSWGRRRELIRKVRRGAVAAEEDLPLLRQTARQMIGQRWVVVPFAGLVTMQLGQTLLQYTVFSLALGVVAASMFALAGWQLLRDGRRAEAFLRAHRDPGEVSGGGEMTGAGPRPAPGTMAD